MTSRPEKTHPAASEPPLKRWLRAVHQRWLDVAGAFLFRTGPAPGAGLSDRPSITADQRSQPRIPLKNTSVRVTDGCLCATARIDNISPSGICLCALPEQLYRSAGQLTVFSSDNPGLPVLRIEPRWQRTGWGGKIIGATILNASETWRLFFVHAASRIEA